MDLYLVVKIISKVSDVEKLNKLIDPNMKDDNGRSILQTICESDHVFEESKKIISLLIEAGADVNYQNKEGLTALHYASVSMRPNAMELMKILIDAGVDPNIKDSVNRSPILYIKPYDSNWQAKIDMLLDAGANLK
jgi:ankyrin repeat protein